MVSDKVNQFSIHIFRENIESLLGMLLKSEVGCFVLACLSVATLLFIVTFVVSPVFQFFYGFLDPTTFCGGG